MEFFGLYLDLNTYVIYLCRLILSLVGIILNTTNIFVLCTSPGKISPMGRLVINLAVADITVCICDIWSILLVVIFPDHLSSSTFCAISFYTFLQIATFLATLLAVMLIAINNYLMVLKPLKHSRIVTRSFVNRSVVLLWSSAVILSGIAVVLPGLAQSDSDMKKHFNNNTDNVSNIYTGNQTYFSQGEVSKHTGMHQFVYDDLTHTEKKQLSGLNIHTNLVASGMKKSRKRTKAAPLSLIQYNSSRYKNRAFGLRTDQLIKYVNSTKLSFCDKIYFNFVFDPYIIFTAGTLTSVLLLLLMYCRICGEIRRFANRSYLMAGHSVSRRKSTITTFFIVFSFLLCWLPSSTNFLVIYFDDSMQWEYSAVYRNTVFIFQLINTIIDPILYAFRLPEVRKCYHMSMKRIQGITRVKQETLPTNV